MALEQKDLSKILETAIVAARLAGQKALEEADFVKFRIKNNCELVTDADAKCQQIIIDRIKETYPDHGFIAEEGQQDKMFKQPPRGGEPIWWVIDPIDGTNNFARKIPIFAVSIAAMYEGQPIVGVIFDPSTDSMFTAVKDLDAQMNGRKITVSDDKMGEFSSVGLDSHLGDTVPSWALEIMQRTRFRILGSAALQLAYAAKGSLIATVLTCPKIWDIAAGVLIAQSAGALVTDWQGENIFPLDLDNYQGQKLNTLVANKNVHAEILSLLKNVS